MNNICLLFPQLVIICCLERLVMLDREHQTRGSRYPNLGASQVMGIYYEFSITFAKSQIAAGQKLPVLGTVFLSLNDLTKLHLSMIARAFLGLGFKIVSTSGTAHNLKLDGIPVERVLKLHEGRPHAGDMLANGQIQLMAITSSGGELDQIDGLQLRRMALAYKIPVITTVAGALATSVAIKSLKCSKIEMIALQDYFNSETENEKGKNFQSVSSSAQLNYKFLI